MNLKQKIVLIIGVFALLVVVFDPPEYIPVGAENKVQSRIDVGGAFLRAFGVIGATLLITYVFKDKKENKP